MKKLDQGEIISTTQPWIEINCKFVDARWRVVYFGKCRYFKFSQVPFIRQNGGFLSLHLIGWGRCFNMTF